MAKKPAFQFYPRDWLADPQLRQASPATRGIWIDCLCFMWESSERGKLVGTPESLSRLLGITPEEFKAFLDEIMLLDVGDVTLCNKKVTLANRRMVRDENARNNTKKRVQRHRQKRCNGTCNGDVTPPSSSSSSLKNKSKNTPPPISPPSKKFSPEVPPEIIAAFNSCWEAYPVHHNREGALKEWIACWQAGELDNSQLIHGRILELKQYDARWLEGKYPNMDRFIRERRWNDEPHEARPRAAPQPTTVHQQRQQQSAERAKLLQEVKNGRQGDKGANLLRGGPLGSAFSGKLGQ